MIGKDFAVEQVWQSGEERRCILSITEVVRLTMAMQNPTRCSLSAPNAMLLEPHSNIISHGYEGSRNASTFALVGRPSISSDSTKPVAGA